MTHDPSAPRPGGFTAEMLALVERVAGAVRPPPVRALHMPPVFTPGEKDGEFCALELGDGSIGLSYVLLGDTLKALLGARPDRQLGGMEALALARWYRDADPARRALGFAAVNAISQHLFRRTGWEPDWTTDSMGLVDPRPGERVGMVGFFPPLARAVVETGASLVVIELDPALAGQKDGYRVTLDAGELAGCDKVLSTTTLMLNDTLDAVLAASRAARQFVMIGPGGGCLPDPLFARGVTALGGTAIVDRDGFVDALSRGQRWGAFARKYTIARDRYPGADALLARLP